MSMNSSRVPPRNKSRGVTGRSGGRSVNAKGTGSQNAQAVSYNFEGIYGNPRFSHVLATLTGCKVQVQVKNGNKYEGIFRTASPKAEFALEMAHKLDESSKHELVSTLPSRDTVVDKLILKAQDIVSLSALDVDMDYATKDAFATDTMISGKLNGQVNERDLQPWQGDAQSEETGLEGETSNGWDVDEMLRINSQKFGVSSTFDENMSQYTTPLEKKDTKEYKEREQEAAKLAKEIEQTPQYQHRLAKELEGSEEDRFSAVQRPGSSGDAGQPNSNNVKRYIPPQMRNRSGPPVPQQQQQQPPQGHYQQQHHRRPMPSQGPYRTQHVPRDSHPATETVQANVNGSVERGERKVLDSGSSTPSSGPPPSAYSGKRKLSDIVRGGPADGKPDGPPPSSSSSSSNISSNPKPLPQTGGSLPPPELQKQQPPPQQQQPPPPQQAAAVAAPQQQQQSQPQQQADSSQVTNQAERKSSKSRSDVGDMKKIEDLKKFGADFKLQQSSGKTKEAEKGNPRDSKESKTGETSVAASTSNTDNPKESTTPAPTPTSKTEDITKKSTLNPEAKEFNPHAKSFVPKVGVAKTPTPPRQQQHSPVVMAAPQPANIHTMSYTGQPVYSGGVSQQYTVMTSTPMQVTMPAAPTMVTGMTQVQQKAAYPQKRPPTIVTQQRMQHHPDVAQPGHVLPVSAATGQPIVAQMGYSQTQFVQYAAQPHAHGAVMNQPMLQQHVQYPHIQYQQKPTTMYRMIPPQHQGQLATSPHQAPQHPYPTQDAPQSAAPVYVSPPQPQPHPQAQHQPQPQPQPHPSAQPQPHMHHPHAQQRHTPPQQSQQQGQTAQHQQGQMPGQQQAAQQHASHPTPSPVHQVPHSAPPPTQNAHLAHQAHPQQQILYQPAAHQMQPPPQALQHTPQSPQGIHPPPPQQQTHSQAQAHQIQQMPVASHTASPHITTVTPVHPQPYPHPHPQVQQQVVMVGPQQGHGHAHNSSAGGHAGAGGVVASNAPTQMAPSYLQVDGKVMVLSEGNAYYSAAPRISSPGPAHAQQPVHQQYPQNN
ncbi:uncharacterized protein LOC144448871 isoform X3 [Glandiceps talaboti]